MKHSFWKTLASSLGYLAIAVVCLIRWNMHDPWQRIDRFAGGYFILRLIGSLHSIISSLGVFRSQQLREEWWSLHSDRTWTRWVMLLMALDLVVFLDYGHGQFTPWLAQPLLVAMGVVDTLMYAVANTYVQERAGQANRGRANAVFSLAFLGGIPVGNLAVGALAREEICLFRRTNMTSKKDDSL